jgi:hypothetical protein
VDLIREILASHESGISRGGLLAWARLRGDPQMTDEALDAALAELGDQVVDVQGFLYLRENAPASALGEATPPAALPAPTPASWSSPVAPSPDGPPGWVPPDGRAGPPPDGAAWPPPPEGQPWPPPEGQPWPPPSTGSTRTMIVAAVGVLVFVGIAGLAALLLRAGETGETPVEPTPTAGTVVEAGSLQVGDCIILPSEDQFDEVRRLECTAPHDGEIFFVGDHPDGDYPSEETFDAFVDEQCLPAFAAFTGSAFDDQDVLDIGWFTPTEGSWANGDREVSCHLSPIDGSQTSQSYRDANP